jgi:tetratricopeptide (TPR) repeat protein
MAIAAAAAAALALVPAGAGANVWRDATDDTQRKAYDDQLANGDRAVELASLDSESPLEAQHNLDAAIQAYRTAAKLEPDAAEPYYRIARSMYQLYFDCPHASSGMTASKLCVGDLVADLAKPRPHQLAEAILAAWAAFEARAPLDPRITSHFLFERAILETKLATPAHWVAAAHDYEQLLARDDFDSEQLRPLAEGNLAETYMMLGRLDDAIDAYRLALRHGSRDALYGLAIALDRDDQTEFAEDAIREAGDDMLKQFIGNIRSNDWFFVPDGERYYYLALIEETLGNDDAAAADWQHFIDSGAHPQYQPRARAHIEALHKAHPGGLRPPARSPLDESEDE